MRCYHRSDASDAILADGFRDGLGNYLTDSLWTGVWFSDRPLDENEGARGSTVIAVEVPDDVFAAHEWVEDGKPYREALIPAAIVNQYPRESVPEDD